MSASARASERRFPHKFPPQYTSLRGVFHETTATQRQFRKPGPGPYIASPAGTGDCGFRIADSQETRRRERGDNGGFKAESRIGQPSAISRQLSAPFDVLTFGRFSVHPCIARIKSGVIRRKSLPDRGLWFETDRGQGFKGPRVRGDCGLAGNSPQRTRRYRRIQGRITDSASIVSTFRLLDVSTFLRCLGSGVRPSQRSPC